MTHEKQVPQTSAFALVRVGRWVKPIFAVLSAVFIVFAAVDMVRRWDGATIQLRPNYVVLALLASALAMFFQFRAWRALVERWAGVKMPELRSWVLYLDSQIARYTPGKVGLLAVRVAGARDVGVSAKAMGATLLVELMSWCATGALLGTSIWLLAPAELTKVPTAAVLALLTLAGCVLGLAFLLFVDRKHFPRGLVERLGAEGRGVFVPFQASLWHFAHFAAWCVSGMLLVMALGGGVGDGLYLGAVLCMAIIGGFLAFLAPAGAGVREAIVIWFAEPLLGASSALAFGLLARAISLLSDVGLWALFRFQLRRRSSSDA